MAPAAGVSRVRCRYTKKIPEGAARAGGVNFSQTRAHNLPQKHTNETGSRVSEHDAMSEAGVFQLLRAAEQAKNRKQLQEERVATANLAQAETEAAAATAEAAKAESAALVAAKAAGNSTAGLKRDRATSTRARAVPAERFPNFTALPLIGAAADPALLHQLLEGGEDVNSGIFQGLSADGRRAKHTPLHEASKQLYNENAVKLLLDAGATYKTGAGIRR